MAVGVAGGPSASSFRTLAEQWNGTAWTIVSMPKIGGPNEENGLAGVSCPRAANCTAVGNLTIRHKRKLLVEHWNGTRWTVGDPAVPPRHHLDAFSGVSCLAKQGCIAVGDYSGLGGKTFPLAEQHS
jgi:hypothetical protein